MRLDESLRTYRLGFTALAVCLIVAYWRVGELLVRQWYTDPNYSHGFFVPVIAGWFLYRDREALRDVQVDPALPGLLVLLCGMGMMVLGFLATELMTMRVSLVVVLAGLVLYLFGRPAFRRLRLPLFYLLLMIPLPYILYDAAAFPLKLIVTNVSVGVLKLAGLPVLREGNIIIFPELILEVADACSGLRSLMTLVTLAVTCAFLMLRSPALRVVLIVSSVPIAVVTNMFRVIITGILADQVSPKFAEGVFHEMAGLGVFVLALVLTGLLTVLLRWMEVKHVA